MDLTLGDFSCSPHSLPVQPILLLCIWTKAGIVLASFSRSSANFLTPSTVTRLLINLTLSNVWHLCVCTRKIKFKWADHILIYPCLTGQLYICPAVNILWLPQAACHKSQFLLFAPYPAPSCPSCISFAAVLGWKNYSPSIRNCQFSWTSCVFPDAPSNDLEVIFL